MPLFPLSQRQRGDPLPDDPAAVVLVPIAGSAGPAAVARAVELAGDATVAVVMVLRIHGSSFGFPNPGLMPTKKEIDQVRKAVDQSIRAIERRGGRADGQVTATRGDAKVIAAAALRRGAVRVVIDDDRHAPRWRQVVEGNLAHAVQRRVGPRVMVETMSTRENAPS